MKMKILLLSHLFAHNTANTYRYWALSEHFSKEGYDVDIIGYKKLDTNKILPNGVRYWSALDVLQLKNIVFLPILTIIEFVKIIKNKRSYIDIKSGILNGAIKIIIKSLLRSKKYDIIIVSVVPWTYYSLIPFLRKNAPVILDVSDPLYKNAVIDNVQIGFERCKLLEQRVFNLVDKIIVMSEPLLELYATELNVEREKMRFVPPPISKKNVYKKDKYIYEFENQDVIKLLYAGTIYPGFRDENELVKAIKGENKFSLEIISRINKNSLLNIKYSNWLPKEELFLQYDSSDILVFIDNFYGYQVPSKIFELLALQKPILFIYDERNLYLYNILKNQKGIFLVKNKASNIRQVIHDIQKMKKIVVNYNIDLKYYTPEYMCHEFDLCISDIKRNICL